MAVYTTATAIGQREDLSDLIYNLSPTETPFLNSVGKTKASAVYHEWQKDSLASVNLGNAVAEGADAVSGTLAPTTRIGNRTQISQKTISVSGTLDTVSKAGRRKETAYQLSKASAELKRDMESILLSNQVADSGSVRKLGGLQTWINTNKSLGATGVAGNNGTVARTNGTARAFTQDMVNAVMASAYTNGGSPTMLLVTPKQKQVASGFAGIATRFRDVPKNQQAQIVGAADVYVSDFGIIQIVPSRFIPTQTNSAETAFLLDTDMASVAYLRPFETNPLAKVGDSEQTQLLVEYTLQVNNESGHGIIADLSV